MGQEIERKFLVDHNKWKLLTKPKGELYRQGYLVAEPNKTIRVRQTNEKGYLTIKGITTGATRPEYEYEIPLNEAKELLDNFSITELSKIRYKINFDSKIWEIDEFLGANHGLIVAEVELSSEEELYNIPEWVIHEVTDQAKYYNVNLADMPYKDW
jgi:CYTH domain-containing protein